ncbi:signal peptidase I [Candidatus Saccharibacteria bacterium]|nr:MAG: signal peptidase I [Candidatus Saccharibacteria bacterium]
MRLGYWRQIPAVAWWLLAGLLLTSWAYQLAVGFGWLPAQIGPWVMQPFVSLPFAVLAYLLLLERHSPKRLRARRDKTILVASLMVLWFVVYFLSGLITTYVHNALTPNLAIILQNVFSYSVPVIAIEYFRYKLIHSVSRRHIVWFGMVLSAVISLAWIDMKLLFATQDIVYLIEMLIREVAVIFAINAAATYLSATVGIGAALVYRLGDVAMVTLLPVIPRYDWYLSSITAILLAMAIVLVVSRSSQKRHQHHAKPHFHSWWARRLINGALVVIFVAGLFFVSGQFRYYPVVVMSNSMKPVFSRGAMVILEKTDPSTIREGDIIRYKVDQTTVTHRVVEIIRKNNQIEFVLKGDNNPENDNKPVLQSQVTGVVKASVPLLGYPTVWLNELAQKVGGQ